MADPFPDHGSIPFQRHRDVGGVVNAVVAFMRLNARELFVGYLALVAPLSILSTLSAILWQNQIDSADATDEAFDPGLIADMFGPSYWTLIVSSGVLFAFSQASVAAYARLYREGHQGAVSAGDLWTEVKGLVMPTLWMTLLLFVSAMGLSIVGAILIAATIGLLGVSVGAFVGAALIVAFAFWTMPYVHIAFASRMTESATVFEAVGRAFSLVRGMWLSSFGSVLLPWIVALGLLTAVNLASAGIAALVGLNSLSGDPGATTALASLIAIPFGILGTLAYILPALAAFFLHGSLVDDLDGPSVEDDLDLLERGVEAAPTPGWDTPEAPPTPASGGRPARDPDPSLPSAPEAEPPRPPGGFRGGNFS